MNTCLQCRENLKRLAAMEKSYFSCRDREWMYKAVLEHIANFKFDVDSRKHIIESITEITGTAKEVLRRVK